MAVQHTPGPWKVVRESEGNGWKGIGIFGDGAVLANIVMQLNDNELANARLMAASPRLLDVVQDILDEANETNPNIAHIKGLCENAINQAIM